MRRLISSRTISASRFLGPTVRQRYRPSGSGCFTAQLSPRLTMHAFFLTALPPRSDLEQPRQFVVGAVGFGVTPTTHTGQLLDVGLMLLMLNTAPGRSRGDRFARGPTRRPATVLR